MLKLPGVQGDRFGRLVILKRGRMSLCRCDCGIEKLVKHSQLAHGKTRSCGCLRAELMRAIRTTHGESNRTDEYRIWKSMITRCHNPNRRCFPQYGGRGIRVCAEWMDSYDAFLADVGRRPSRRHSIDRIDNDRGYEPGNVRWATPQQQGRNKRTNRYLEFNGERMTVVDWAEKVGLAASVLFHRLYHGWSVDRALSTPRRQRRSLLGGK